MPDPGSQLNNAEPQRAQKIFSRPPSGVQPRSSSSPCTTSTDPGTARALADDAVPVRRWQRVQWQ